LAGRGSGAAKASPPSIFRIGRAEVLLKMRVSSVSVTGNITQQKYEIELRGQLQNDSERWMGSVECAQPSWQNRSPTVHIGDS
jgi:hypothetical protein